jgi:integrase
MAEETEAEVRAAFRHALTPDSYLLGETMKSYLKDTEKRVRKQTLNAKSRDLYAFRDWIGENTELSDVTPEKAGRYVTAKLLPKGHAAKTTREIIANLGAFFNWCIDASMTAGPNPFARKGRLAKDSTKGTVKRRPWTPEEIEKLLNGLPHKGDLWSLSVLALYTGARIEELCGLEVKNVRDDRLCIVPERGTKTEAGMRDVPLHPILRPLVRELAKNSTDGYLISGLPVGGEDDKRSHEASKRFGRARRKLKLDDPRIPFHAFRNTFANALERANVPASTAKLIVGHKRQDLTYGHYSPGLPLDLQQEAVNKVTYGAAVDALASIATSRAPAKRKGASRRRAPRAAKRK